MKKFIFILVSMFLLCSNSFAANYSGQYGLVNVQEQYKATAFRIDSNEDGQYVLVVVVVPINSSATFHVGSIAVEQNGVAYDVLMSDPLDYYETSTYGFTGTIYGEKRLYIKQETDNKRFDDQDSLTLVFNNYSSDRVRLTIPAAPGYNKLKAPSYDENNQLLTIPYVKVGSSYWSAELFFNGSTFELGALEQVETPD